MENPRSALAIESWTLYAFGVCLILARLTCRLATLGSVCKLQLDDWIMVFILIPFTGTVFCVNEAFELQKSTSIESDIIWTRKMRFVLEELKFTTNWLVKACLLILYRRIFPASTSKRERRYVIWTSAICILSYITIQISLPLWCYPTYKYWSSSPPNVQCTTYHNHAVLTLALSATTTVATMIIPVPMIPTPRKVLLAILLLVGALALVSGILSRYYVLISPSSSSSLHWLVAELAVMILFANLPILSALYTSTTSSRIRKLSSNLSIPQWPRSRRASTLPHTQRQRLDSTATTISTFSPTRACRVESMTSTIPQVDADDGWSDKETSLTVPSPLVRKMTLTDPPPELEVYWTSRRPSTRDADLESVSLREIQWPLR